MKTFLQLAIVISAAVCSIGGAEPALGQLQTNPAGYSISTPRPINPAASTTNPSALATQGQNPYLGSTPVGKVTDQQIPLSLQEAVERGLRYNLGLIESSQATAEVRAQRLRALATLLPNVSVKGEQAFEDLSLQEIGLRLPATPGVPTLPPTTGSFAYQDARVSLQQSVYSQELHDRYRAQKSAEQASAFTTRDSRDVVVYAVGVAYLQVVASAARVETAKAQLASARELDQQTADQFKHEVSPEIDAIRAQVERQSAEQRLINATDAFEKDNLALGRIIGIPIGQKFTLADTAAYHPLADLTQQAATAEALASRSDLRSADANVRAAESGVHAEKAQRLPALSVHASYGGAGTNVGSFKYRGWHDFVPDLYGRPHSSRC